MSWLHSSLFECNLDPVRHRHHMIRLIERIGLYLVAPYILPYMGDYGDSLTGAVSRGSERVRDPPHVIYVDKFRSKTA